MFENEVRDAVVLIDKATMVTRALTVAHRAARDDEEEMTTKYLICQKVAWANLRLMEEGIEIIRQNLTQALNEHLPMIGRLRRKEKKQLLALVKRMVRAGHFPDASVPEIGAALEQVCSEIEGGG